mmetsp:Transcript_8262/g.13378  ORF Transcript_8262/g.13378 Transcript_8262/m.13378 type:complete len:103 (+) Transcript_8262:489-797(+)
MTVQRSLTAQLVETFFIGEEIFRLNSENVKLLTRNGISSVVACSLVVASTGNNWQLGKLQFRKCTQHQLRTRSPQSKTYLSKVLVNSIGLNENTAAFLFPEF